MHLRCRNGYAITFVWRSAATFEVVTSKSTDLSSPALLAVSPSLLNSPELRFVCEDVRSGVEERRNRPGHAVWEGQFDVAT